MDYSIFVQEVNILGVGVSAINMEIALTTIDGWIKNGESNYVCVTPVHSIMQCLDRDDLRLIYNRAGLVTPDGMPLVWISHLAGFPQVQRVYGPDLMLALCEHSSEKGYRHYFYGGAPGVADTLVSKLRLRISDLAVAGTYCPPFRALSHQEDREIVDTINAARPDILWVGLGAPKQEYWMAEHIDRLNATVLIGVGAAFDFHSGAKAQAPRWMQRSGLEWLFRLGAEPNRLWKRYLINNPLFIGHVLLQWSRLRRYPLSESILTKS